jgi:hypothetical protein
MGNNLLTSQGHNVLYEQGIKLEGYLAISALITLDSA